MEPATERRLAVLRGHLGGGAAAGGAVSLSATAATSVGAEWAKPCGYSVALPERLPGDFNVYRCARERAACAALPARRARRVVAACADCARRPRPPPPRSNAKYPTALMTGFPAPDDNIATVHGACARRCARRNDTQKPWRC